MTTVIAASTLPPHTPSSSIGKKESDASDVPVRSCGQKRKLEEDSDVSTADASSSPVPAAATAAASSSPVPAADAATSPAPTAPAAAAALPCPEGGTGGLPPVVNMTFVRKVDRMKNCYVSMLRERNAITREFTKVFTVDLLGLLRRNADGTGISKGDLAVVTTAVDMAKKYQPLLLIENFFEFVARPFASKFRAGDFDYFLDPQVFARESQRIIREHQQRIAASQGAVASEKDLETTQLMVDRLFGMILSVIVHIKKNSASTWTRIKTYLTTMFDLSANYNLLNAVMSSQG